MLGGGSGGGGGFVKNGLALNFANSLGLANLYTALSPQQAFSDEFTAEICCTVTGINASSQAGRLLVFGSLYIGVLTMPAYVAAGADYGVQSFYDGESTGCATGVAGMHFGDLHTFSTTQKNSVSTLYVDGTYIGEWSSRNAINAQNIYLMCSNVSVHATSGTWNNARIYNRALTTSELLANHAEDVRRYGGDAI